MYHLKEIADKIGGVFVGSVNTTIRSFLFDSRHFQTPADTLFIAIQSARNDGHQYIADLYQKGLRSFLVQKDKIKPLDFPEAAFVLCDSPLKALQTLAEQHRQKFSIPVIGITGSNGKTVVKEWLYQCLKEDFRICRSPRSYNSQVGVALSVLNLDEHHNLAIFEAGISQPGEMAPLQKMIRPSIGVFTHLGGAHSEGFSSQEQKLHEKLKLFTAVQKIIWNGAKASDFSTCTSAQLISAEAYKQLTINLPFRDEASIENAATCAAVLSQLGYADEEIMRRLSHLQAVALRLEMRSGIQNSLVINDYYNSDLDSLRIALNYLKQNSKRPNHVVVLSDIEQSGLPATSLYKKVSDLLAENKIALLVGIGSEITKHRSYFPSSALFFQDVGAFMKAFRGISFQFSQSTILLKGARAAGFEQISRALQLKSHDTVFEINLDRLRENVNYYRSLVKDQVKLMCMVKATGYGSGAAEIGRALQSMGANYLAVAYADEGVDLRESLITLPIMVMSPEEEAFDDIINFSLEPEIYSFEVLGHFLKKLDAHGITEAFPIHLKIDTGMKRLGFVAEEVDELCLRLQNISNVRVASIFSHLAASDNGAHDEFTNHQLSEFETAVNKISQAIGYLPIRHICNSGGISRFPQAHFEMVRLGIGMYGIGVDEKEQVNLKNVGSLKSRISQIKTVKKSETVGYNRKGQVTRDSTIAIIPIGYADGFSRALGNGKHGVYIEGKFCRTVGNVCMDMCMVDVTDITCKAGDEVMVFSSVEQIQALAEVLQTIPYEILTSVSARVKRLYTQE